MMNYWALIADTTIDSMLRYYFLCSQYSLLKKFTWLLIKKNILNSFCFNFLFLQIGRNELLYKHLFNRLNLQFSLYIFFLVILMKLAQYFDLLNSFTTSYSGNVSFSSLNLQLLNCSLLAWFVDLHIFQSW